MILIEKYFKTLIRPIVSEKTSLLSKGGTFVFEVLKKINRLEIKNAVETIHSVKVRKIRVLVVKGKKVKNKKSFGKKRNWKKAYITLEKGKSLYTTHKKIDLD